MNQQLMDINKLKGGSIAIVKNGEVYVNIAPGIDSIKNDEKLINWLSKYIDLN